MKIECSLSVPPFRFPTLFPADSMNVVQRFESVYDHPTLYDVLFSDSCKKEIDFLLEMARCHSNSLSRAHSKRKKLYSFLEPACGTGRLLWRLGKLGHDIAGLDLNPKAVTFCNRRLRRHGLPEVAMVADMSDFSLMTFSRKKPFDLAFNFVSSFLHLTNEHSAKAHLTAVSKSLTPGGLYLLGLHLHPRGETTCQTESWAVRHGALSVNSHLHRKDLDRRRRIETVEFRIRATTPRRQYEVTDVFSLRTYSLGQFRALLKAVNCFEVLATYDFGLDTTRPITIDHETEDVVFVLRNRKA